MSSCQIARSKLVCLPACLPAVFTVQALGAFHVAVEIFGWEWSFGWNDDGSTGVFSGLPAMCDMHTYREKVSLGFTTLSRAQVDKKLAQLEDEWMGDDYDMVRSHRGPACLPVACMPAHCHMSCAVVGLK
jgi:hypothetical protein